MLSDAAAGPFLLPHTALLGRDGGRARRTADALAQGRRDSREPAALLADLYGPRHLFAEGVLPPALVYPDPAFLRACRAPCPASR
jgi:hypothetical protein